jgi:hypothetical protein
MTVRQHYLGPLAACFTPEVARKIVDFRADDVTEARLLYLRERANEGTLSESERAEYQEFVDALDFVGVLKAQARATLDSTRK